MERIINKLEIRNDRRIINTLIDNDLYKLTMGQAVFHNFYSVGAGFKFINRAKTEFPQGFGQKLQDQVEMMADLSLNNDQRKFLDEKCTYLTPDYLDWFSKYHFNPNEVSINQNGRDLSVDIEGPWHRSIYWEVPLMATISELYFQELGQLPDMDWEDRASQKAKILLASGARHADFGTRRRASYLVHDRVVEILKNDGGKSFLGTSNVELAMKHDLTPIGTFAHEWVQGMAGIFGVENANKMALEIWAKEFNGKLATVLTDTFTTDNFLKSYTAPMAEIFKTLRQDSGSPEDWTDKVVDHIQNTLGLNPKDFTALYSDALNVPRALEILKYNEGKINTLFGIGTNYTNDIGRVPLNMVIKMFHVTKPQSLSQISVVKLSDDLGKISGDRSVVAEIMERLGLAA